jgi:hypothetical protein
MCLTKQHHIIGGTRFGQDWTSGLGHIKIAMSRLITSWHRSGIFRPQFKVILGKIQVLQYLQIFQLHSCACVLENVPPLGDF